MRDMSLISLELLSRRRGDGAKQHATILPYAHTSTSLVPISGQRSSGAAHGQ
jgi:hypothetical protein